MELTGARHEEAAGMGPMYMRGECAEGARGGAGTRFDERWTRARDLGSHGANAGPWSGMGGGGCRSTMHHTLYAGAAASPQLESLCVFRDSLLSDIVVELRDVRFVLRLLRVNGPTVKVSDLRAQR